MGKAAGDRPSGLLPVVSEAAHGHKRLKIANVATEVRHGCSLMRPDYIDMRPPDFPMTLRVSKTRISGWEPKLPPACADAPLRKPAGDALPCSLPFVEEPGLPLGASSPRSGPNAASGEWVPRFPLTGWHRAGTEGAHIG